MNRKRRLTLFVSVSAVLLAVASALAWRSVAAQSGGGPRVGPVPSGRPAADAAPAPQAPVPGGPGFYSQSPVPFRPVVQTYGWAFFGTELYNPDPGYAYYAASLPLPNGATITKLVGYYFDQCGGSDLVLTLFRCLLEDSSCEVMGLVASSGSMGSYRYAEDLTIDYPVVDQQSYSYIAYLELPGGCAEFLTLVNVRIDYGFEANLPLVTRQ